MTMGVPSRRKRARAAVWLGLLAFVSGTVLLNILLDTTRVRYLDPEFGWHARHTQWRTSREPERELGIVLGTSRAHVGFNPDELGLDGPDLPLVANFAQTASVPVYSLLNLRRLLDLGIRPAFVLFEIMPLALANDGAAEDLVPPHRMGYRDSIALRDYGESPTAWLHTRVAPWSSYRINILAHQFPDLLADGWNPSWYWTRPSAAGWMPINPEGITPERRAQYTAIAQTSYADSFRDFRIAPRMDKANRELLSLCRDRGIPCHGFRMPESPRFRSWYAPSANAALAAYLAELRRDFDFECFDCAAWSDEIDFLDGHHLLVPGAAKFSKRFGSACLKPWLGELKRLQAESPKSPP